MLAVAVTGLSLSFVNWLCTGPSLTDRFLSLVVGHDTAYSKEYSHNKWASLRAGMTTAQVEAVVGKPLKTHGPYPDGTEQWIYSESPGDTHYWLRVVVCRAGKVVELIDSFYFD
jgi:hypothetical protein